MPQSPMDRRLINRPEAIRRQPEVPQPSREPEEKITPRATVATQQTGSSPQRPSLSKLQKAVLAVILLVVLAVLATIAWSVFAARSVVAGNIDNSKHQAVFLTTGQAYFGKLEIVNDNYLKLTQVFYVQPEKSDQPADGEELEAPAANNNLQLVKLGDEVHGPEDSMVINRDQVLFFENLKSNSKVSQLIKQYQPGSN